MSINQYEFEEFVSTQALENAINFKGKANPKVLLGKSISKFPDIKSNVGEYANIINGIVDDVNSMTIEEQNDKLRELNPDFFDRKKEKKEVQKKDGLPNLPDTENGVVVRIEPAPSGHLHLGHLFPIVANYELKKKYGGKFIVRIADTNPDNIDISNYDKVIDDIKWICDGEIDEIFYQSERVPIYYKYLRQLAQINKIYVCNCDSETFKSYTDNCEMCPHAKMNFDTQKEKFEKFMKEELKDSVLRFRGDIKHKNPAMRSFTLARINENKHAKVGHKYKVWPTMNIAVAIDDVLMGLTHVIRGKDHEINMERQMLIHKALGMKSPNYFHIGRMKFVDMELSKTKLAQMIEKEEFSGWDDPRVPSVLSYRKRGYRAEAFRKFILSLGISKRDSKITSEEYHKGLDYFNKQILETESDRCFFVHNPKTLHILNVDDFPSKEIKLNKHPDDSSRGFREFRVESDWLIDGLDFDNLSASDKLRLKHMGNFEIIEKESNVMRVKFISKEYSKDFKFKRNIHYVPFRDNEEVEVFLTDNSRLKGFTENLHNLKEGSSIQFERFGFVRFDSRDKSGKKIFYFTHR